MITLQTEQTLRLSGWRARRIQCHAGVLWITVEGDPHDHFICTGESLAPGHGLTLITALEPAALSVLPCSPGALRGRVARILDLARRVLGRVHRPAPHSTVLRDQPSR